VLGLCIGPPIWSQHQQPADVSTGGIEPDVGAQDSRSGSITQGVRQSKDQAMQEQSKACRAQTWFVCVCLELTCCSFSAWAIRQGLRDALCSEVLTGEGNG
jgi:hypothetical protein